MINSVIRSGIFAMFLALPGLVTAQTQSFNYLFDISLGIAKVGEMRVNADINGASYTASGVLESTGVAGAIFDVRYETTVRGTTDHPWHFVPQNYTSISIEKDDRSDVNISFSGNRISGVSHTPPRDVSVPAVSDAIDPMTLIYFLVRPVPAENVCGGTFKMFDGREVMNVAYTNARRFNDGRIECSVTYSGSNTGVALSSVTFSPGDDGMMYISRFSANTNAGELTARRR